LRKALVLRLWGGIKEFKNSKNGFVLDSWDAPVIPSFPSLPSPLLHRLVANLLILGFLDSWIPLVLLHFANFLLYLLRSPIVAPLAHFVANLLELLADALQILLVGPPKILKLVFGESGSALSDLLQLSQDFFGILTVWRVAKRLDQTASLVRELS